MKKKFAQNSALSKTSSSEVEKARFYREFDRQLESLLSARDRAPSGSRVSDDDFSPRENTLDGQERPLANADSRSVPETPLSAERIRAILAGKRVRAAAPKSSAFEKKIEKKKTEETVSMPELERESAPAKINSFPESESRFSATDLSTSSPDGGISSRGGRVENNSTLASAKILSRPANSGVYVPHLGGRGVFSPGRKVKPKTSTRSEPRPTSRAPRPGSSSEKVSSKKSRSSREEEKTFLSPKNLRPRSGRAVAPSGREITAFTAEAAGRGLPPRRVVPISRASLPETRLPKAKGGLTNTRSKLSPPEAPVLELGQVKKSSPPRLAPLSDYRPRRKTVSSIPPVGEKERIVSSDSAREGRISFFPGLARPRQKDLSRAHLSVGSGRYEQARERSFEEICRRVRENMDRQGNFLDEGKIVLEKTLSSREEAAEKSLPSRGKASDKFVEEKKSSPASGFLSRESSGEKVAVGERKGRERVEGRKSSIEKDKSPARASKLPRAVGGVHRRGEISVFAAARKNSAKSSGEKKSAEKTPSRTVSDRAISENSVLAREKTTKVSSEKSTESRFVGKKIFPVGASEKEKAHSPASEATERSFGRDDENTPALSDDLRRHLKKSAPPRSKKTAGKTLPRQAERLAKNSAQKSARSSRGRFPENFSSRSERASLVSSRKKQENSLASAPAGRERTARRDLIAQEEREPVSAPFVSSSKARKSSFSSSFSKREKSRARASFPPARETSSPREHFRDFPPPRRGTAAAAAPGGREAVVSGKFFLVLILVGALSLFGFSLAERAAAMYDDVKSAAERGFASLSLAVEKAKDKNFAASRKNFVKAQKELAAAEASLSSVNRALIDLTRFVPFLSKASSGKNAIVAARRIARAGEAATAAMESVSSVGNPLSPANAEAGNVLRLFEIFQNNLALAEEELRAAEKALAKVDPADVPLEQRAQVAKVTRLLPVALAALEKFNQNTDVLADLLGANGPRKYLFLFQNNHEIRATGGFIGSYGRLDISGGRINRFFIDGIFNPSGQMSEKIVPPKPIQKISAAWNLHDSNWFPDFPTSARKAISFYEKTGGPTVDGVIAITPEVLRKMLEVVGPVDLPEYGTTLTAENFISQLQYEVEVDYDKEENRPKKILSDLAPAILGKIFSSGDRAQLYRVAQAMGDLLAEKDILIYSANPKIQHWIVRAGWSGRLRPAPHDYLMVVNSNINGYKTDGVIDEEIVHEARIEPDGSVTVELTITRRHTGGNTPYEWWNKVNADYMRVYVPRGSKLLSVSGQTKEFVSPPLDYQALGFRTDPDVLRQENSMFVDQETGTRIYNEGDKTVFANWVYVSPQESVTIKYLYKLPFKVKPLTASDPGEKSDLFGSYSVLYQKQPGSNSRLISRILLPKNLKVLWRYPYETAPTTLEEDLSRDLFHAVVLAER